MKKALVLILTVVLAMSLAVPAAAVDSPTAADLLPEVVYDESMDNNLIIELMSVKDEEEMTEEEQNVFKAAQDALEDATPASMKVLYFFYFKAFYAEGGNKTTKVTEPVTFKLKIDNISELVVKQFIDGEWVELNSAINPDGTITIEGAVEGPMAIFVA